MEGNVEILRFVDGFRYRRVDGKYIRIEYDIFMVEYGFASDVAPYCILGVHCKTSSMIRSNTYLVRFPDSKIDKDAILNSEVLADPIPAYIGFGGFKVTPLADPHEAKNSIEAYLLNYLRYIPNIKLNFPATCNLIPLCITFRNFGTGYYPYHYVIYALLIDASSIIFADISSFNNSNGASNLLNIKRQKGLKDTTPIFILIGFCFGSENFGFILDHHFVNSTALHIFGTDNCDIGFYQIFKALLLRTFYPLSYMSMDLELANVIVHRGDWNMAKAKMKGFVEGI